MDTEKKCAAVGCWNTATHQIKQCGHPVGRPCGHFDAQPIDLCKPCYDDWTKEDRVKND